MKTLNTVYLVGGVDGERNAVEALSADDAGEAGRMVRFAGCSQYPVENRSSADAAFLQRIEVVLLAVRFTLGGIERLALQIDSADEAAEAIYVKDFVHRRATGSLALDLLLALSADTVYVAVLLRIFHSLNEKVC